MSSTVSCIIITTLIIISLANFMLLVHVIMNTLKRCDDIKHNRLKKVYGKIRRDDDSVLEETILENMETSIQEYRSMAALIRIENDDDLMLLCGASIVSTNWVLTTAHCAREINQKSLDQIKVLCNATRLLFGLWHDVKNVIVHEGFNPKTRQNDIAMVSVQKPFKAKYAVPIALPTENYIYVANSTATALGWEAIDSAKIYAIEMKLVWNKVCDQTFPDDKLRNKSMFCAARTNDVLCMFDDGSQLVQNNVLIGIWTRGVGCRKVLKPEVYLKVGNYEKWIRKVEERGGAYFKAIN